jgi:hypothetical protein
MDIEEPLSAYLENKAYEKAIDRMYELLGEHPAPWVDEATNNALKKEAALKASREYYAANREHLLEKRRAKYHAQREATKEEREAAKEEREAAAAARRAERKLARAEAKKLAPPPSPEKIQAQKEKHKQYQKIASERRASRIALLSEEEQAAYKERARQVNAENARKQRAKAKIKKLESLLNSEDLIKKTEEQLKQQRELYASLVGGKNSGLQE